MWHVVPGMKSHVVTRNQKYSENGNGCAVKMGTRIQ